MTLGTSEWLCLADRHYNRPWLRCRALPEVECARWPRVTYHGATRAALPSRAAVIGPPVSKPPFLKHAEQSKTMSEEEFERLQTRQGGRKKKSKSVTVDREKVWIQLQRFWETTEDEPEGLTKRRSCCGRASSVRTSMAIETEQARMMDGLERKALDSDRVQAILATTRITTIMRTASSSGQSF